MADAFRLQSILDLSITRMDEAAKALAQLMASEQDQARKLEMLEQYRAEYQGQFMAAAKSGLTPNQWANYRAFLSRIDDAIVHQQRQVEHSRNLSQAGQREWLDTRTRVKAFETLSDRHNAGVARKQARVEQRVNDDRAGRQVNDD